MGAMTSSGSAIQMNQVTKRFGDKIVLQRCCLTIAPGQSMVLIGQSGGGKSVLLRCVLGLTDWQKGTIQIGDAIVGRETDVQQEQRFANSGVVFQSYALFDSLTIGENVGFRMPGTARQRREAASEILRMVELDPAIIDLYPNEISGGMKRRVSIARAIALRPKYLFFDEPTEGLDPVLCETIAHTIRRVIDTLNATALTITHNMKNAQVIGDRVSLLDQGAIVWQGSTTDMVHDPFPLLHAFVKGQSLQG